MKHKAHELVDQLILGKRFPSVHDFLDEPVKWVTTRHRRFRHDRDIVAWVLLAKKDMRAAASALLHLIADGERE